MNSVEGAVLYGGPFLVLAYNLTKRDSFRINCSM